jgi:hypothetical protein
MLNQSLLLTYAGQKLLQTDLLVVLFVEGIKNLLPPKPLSGF